MTSFLVGKSCSVLMIGRSAPSPAARVALRAIQRSAPDSIFTEFGSVTDVTFMENVFQSYNIGKRDV